MGYWALLRSDVRLLLFVIAHHPCDRRRPRVSRDRLLRLITSIAKPGGERLVRDGCPEFKVDTVFGVY